MDVHSSGGLLIKINNVFLSGSGLKALILFFREGFSFVVHLVHMYIASRVKEKK
jgi:hypothetical protein